MLDQPNPTPTKEWIGTTEVMELFDVSRPTAISRLAKNGIKPLGLTHNHRYERHAVEKLFRETTRNGQA